MDEPDGRLPVSCTVFLVQDSMEGEDGIEASWRYVSHGLRNGAGVAVHLSELRPKGHDNGKGLIASGPVSFARIYSTLNETLRRGGRYKNGAVVCHLDLNHLDINEFITVPREALPWVKRCVNITKDWWEEASEKTKANLLQGIKSGDIWLNKVKYQGTKRIRGNVCQEVYLDSRGTCLLEHINLGACTFDELPQAFREGMEELCELHGKTGVGKTGEYLPPETDRQVGLGMLGLANFLHRYGVTYDQFGRALDQYNAGQEKATVAFTLVKSSTKVSRKPLL